MDYVSYLQGVGGLAEEPCADLVVQLGAVIVSCEWYLDFTQFMKDLVLTSLLGHGRGPGQSPGFQIEIVFLAYLQSI